MYKVVYNAKYGGFGLSDEGIKQYNKRTSQTLSPYDYIPRAATWPVATGVNTTVIRDFYGNLLPQNGTNPKGALIVASTPH